MKKFEKFKEGNREEVPDVPFQMLASLNLNAKEWAAIAIQSSWQTVRMNLNTFARHGVFAMEGMDRMIVGRLRDVGSIRKAKVFPISSWPPT